MANIFQKIAVPKVHFSNFNLTHEYKCGMDFGYLVPIQCVECLPNDTFQGSTEAFIRLAPMKFPLLQRMSLKTYTFFVPNRIIWKYWPEFIAEDDEGVAPAMLTRGCNTFFGILDDEARLLCDYLGLPPEMLQGPISDQSSFPVSLLPFLAYQKIWNDYFRDENLQDDLFKKDTGLLWKICQKQGDLSSASVGGSITDLFKLRKKAWEKDYYTSALPEPQLGDPVPVPVTGTVQGSSFQLSDGELQQLVIYPDKSDSSSFSSTGQKTLGAMLNSVNSGTPNVQDGSDTPITLGFGDGSHFSVNGGMELKDVSFTINDLRLASAIQRFNELLARAGHRYKETILSMFNQVTPDYRLDRPEFICSQSIPIQVSDIPQTSATQSDSPQATLAGKASSYGNGGLFRYHCQEHGFLITLVCAIPRTSYVNGISRMWTREDRYDYYTPVFENLGEQAVLNRELYVQGKGADNETWGYAPRYSEYKYVPSTVHGDLRRSLDFMTLTRMFNELPLLNGDFITPDAETCNRGFAVEDGPEQHLYCQFVNHLYARRPMQKLPIPKLV